MTKRVAIITGAAKGIGKAIAVRLASEGCITVLIDIDDANGNALAGELGTDSLYLHCDITNETDVASVFKTVVDQFGSVDILVNNAGIIKDNVIWKMPTEDFVNVIDINLKGTWLMCKYAAIQMKAQASGRIVNITSRAWLGNAGQSNYSSSKAGVIGLTRVLALELGRYGVLVNSIAPGLIKTPMSKSLPADVIIRLTESQAIKSMGLPEDVAHTVSFFCHESTHFITGQTLYVDGGKSIGAGI